MRRRTGTGPAMAAGTGLAGSRRNEHGMPPPLMLAREVRTHIAGRCAAVRRHIMAGGAAGWIDAWAHRVAAETAYADSADPVEIHTVAEGAGILDISRREMDG